MMHGQPNMKILQVSFSFSQYESQGVRFTAGIIAITLQHDNATHTLCSTLAE
jgi:hypothetical protein